MSMSYSYRVGKSTVSNLVKETCKIIWNCLRQDYLKPPNREKWKKISEDFKHVWQMPNCVGAIDGKHVVIQVGFWSKYKYNALFHTVLLNIGICTFALFNVISLHNYYLTSND